VLEEKYLKPGETGIDDLYRRVARALASVEKEPIRAEWERRSSSTTCTRAPSVPAAS
jgi:ribonucleoside-diphosphate reductase alpha chain